MTRFLAFVLIVTTPAACLFAKSIRDFQVLPANDPATNKVNL